MNIFNFLEIIDNTHIIDNANIDTKYVNEHKFSNEYESKEEYKYDSMIEENNTDTTDKIKTLLIFLLIGLIFVFIVYYITKDIWIM